MIEDNRVDNLILPNLHNSYKYYNFANSEFDTHINN